MKKYTYRFLVSAALTLIFASPVFGDRTMELTIKKALKDVTDLKITEDEGKEAIKQAYKDKMSRLDIEQEVKAASYDGRLLNYYYTGTEPAGNGTIHGFHDLNDPEPWKVYFFKDEWFPRKPQKLPEKNILSESCHFYTVGLGTNAASGKQVVLAIWKAHCIGRPEPPFENVTESFFARIALNEKLAKRLFDDEARVANNKILHFDYDGMLALGVNDFYKFDDFGKSPTTFYFKLAELTYVPDINKNYIFELKETANGRKLDIHMVFGTAEEFVALNSATDEERRTNSSKVPQRTVKQAADSVEGIPLRYDKSLPATGAIIYKFDSLTQPEKSYYFKNVECQITSEASPILTKLGISQLKHGAVYQAVSPGFHFSNTDANPIRFFRQEGVAEEKAAERGVDASDLGYSILAGGHTYKVKGNATPSGGQIHLFYDEKGTLVRDQDLLRKLALGAWTRENIVVAPDARAGSQRVAAILGTSQDLQKYEAIQDVLARAMTEAIEAAITGGASLAKSVPNLTWGVVKNQLLQSPRTLFTLMAQTGLKASLEKYKQLESILPPAGATALDLNTLEKVKELYTQAQVLELPNAALASALMPTSAIKLTEQALGSVVGQLLPGLPNETELVTLKGLLQLQKSVAEAGKDLPALKAYRENLDLALNLAAANNRTIETWVKQAVTAFDSTRGDDELRAMIEKAIKAKGGEDVIRKFNAGHVKSEGKIMGDNGDLLPCVSESWSQEYRQLKSDLQYEVKRKKFRLIHVLNGDKGWLSLNGRTQPATGPTLTGMQEDMYYGRVVSLTPLLEEASFTISRVGETTVDGRAAFAVKVACDGHKDIKLYFDKETRLLAKSEQVLPIPTGKEILRESFFSDFRQIDGLQEPMKTVVFQDGKKHFEGTIREMQFLEKIDEVMFSKP